MSKETLALDIDDVLVDTAPSILNHYQEQYGIRGILFGGLPWGRGHQLPHGVYRADTWRDVNERLKVTEWIG